MGVKILPVREEVFEEGVDPAPKLGKILDAIEGGAASAASTTDTPSTPSTETRAIDTTTRLMADPKEYFKRTFITPNMLSLLEKVVEGFEGKNKVFVLYSFYGGGKTHTLLALIHAFRNPDILTDPDVIRDVDTETKARLEDLSDRIRKINATIVPFAGDSAKYSGTPTNPVNAGGYAYRTVWGYLAHCLGKYYSLKENDEKILAPQQDVVEDLLTGERALFIFDELSEYLKDITGGEYRGYAQAVVNFIEFFVQAVRGSKCVAVITLPVEPSGKADWKYEEDRIIQSLWDSLKSSAEPVEPLRSGETDMVNVLKKRLFESIPEVVKEHAVQKFREKLINYPEYWNQEYLEAVEETYPFSPEYIELLQTLIIRTGMQKTRDALVISMKVLKNIVESGEDPDFIMPWHINLSWVERAFLGGLNNYQIVYIRQVEGIPDIGYGELTRYVLRTIFISTYHYDSAIPREDFPDRRKIVRMVFDPATFTKNNWEPMDVENAIDALLKSPEVTHLNEKDGKFWFWRHPNIKEYIRKRAERIFSDENPGIYDKIKEFVEKGLTSELSQIVEKGKEEKKKKKKREKKVKTHFFEDYEIIDDYGVYPEDEGRLRLIVLLRPDLVSIAEEIYSFAGDGKQRSYKNTIVILAPSEVGVEAKSNRNFRELMLTASMLLATDEILEEITSYYSDYGEEAVEVQKAIIERERKDALLKIAHLIPKVYSYIFHYPTNDSQLRVERVVQPGYNLFENVHLTLVQLQKIVDSMNFDYFSTLIRTEVGIDIERDSKIRTVGQILTWFKQNPRFPIAPNSVVKEAIKEGIKLFRIGLMRDREIFFKPVHSSIPPSKDVEGKAPSQIRDSDGILSRDRAIEEQLKVLKENEAETTHLNFIERSYYVVYPELGGEYYTLSQLETLPDWKDIFLSGVIVKRVEKITSDLLVDVYPASSISVNEGEVAVIKVRARPVNLDIEGVKIQVIDRNSNKAIIDDEMRKIAGGEIIYEYEFEIEPENKVEEYLIKLSAFGNTPLEREARVIVRIKEKVKFVETDVVSMEHEGMKLLRITEIEDFDVLKKIKDSLLSLAEFKGVISGSIKAIYGGGEFELDVRKMELETGVHVSIDVAECGDEREITRKFTVELEDLTLNELIIKKLEGINRKVKYVLIGGE